MTAAQVEATVFVSLVADSRAFKCKGGGAALLEHMSALGCPIESLVVQWFSCLFANTLPWPVVLRVWDLLLLPVAVGAPEMMPLRALTSSPGGTSKAEYSIPPRAFTAVTLGG